MRKTLFWAAVLAAILVSPSTYLAQAASSTSPVILVDDFDQAYSANHLGGAYGVVAQGGEARFDFVQPSIPYLSNNSSLKIQYKLKRSPGFAFLWMKLARHREAHEITEHLDLTDAVFLSFKYQSKHDINFKIELHEDMDSDGRFDIARDRSGFVYSDTVKKFPLEGGWVKVLVPLKRFVAIKDWAKILELVLVFEKDQAGEKGEIFLEDIIFIQKEIKKQSEESLFEWVKAPKVSLNGAPVTPGQNLLGDNIVKIDYSPAEDFDDMESLSLEIQAGGQDAWVPVSTKFETGKNQTILNWEAHSFTPPEKVNLRIVASSFLGQSRVIAGPFEDLRPVKMTDEEFINLVEEKAFFYFKENQNLENGLFYDTTGGGDLSTAVTGFGLSALVIGAERGWIDKAEAKRRVKLCLDSFAGKIENRDGFYYHFITAKDLKRAGTSEISTVDTALLLLGVITAGEYFGGDIKKLSEQIYKKTNWKAFLNHNPDEENYLQFHHGYTPEQGLTDNFWDYYTDETLLLDLLAIGSPTHPVPEEVFYKFQRRRGRYEKMPKFIYTWHGGLFSYQYANAWYDFRAIVDREGDNWFENSKIATLSNRQFAIDHAAEYKTYSPDTWGITSMRVPERYVMHYGPLPNGQNLAEHDGSISPSGPAGSMMFTPYLSLRALKNLYIHYPDLWGIYGFKDSLNIDRYWISPIYYGLGEGIILLSIENFRTGLIWNQFGKNKWVKQGLRKAGFKPENTKKQKKAPFIVDLKSQLDGAPEESRIAFLLKALEQPLSYEDANLLYQEAIQRYGKSDKPQAMILLGKIQAKQLEILQDNDLELGRLYLKNAEIHKSKAIEHFNHALKFPVSELERLDIYKDKIAILRQVLAPLDLDQAEKELAQILKDGIQQKSYNLPWALQWAEFLDEDTAIELRRSFFEELTGRDRKILFESLKLKAKAAFSQGNYGKAADLSEEQIRFMESPEHHGVLVSYLDRTAKAFMEVQKYNESERFYRKILEQYGNAREKERYQPSLAAMLEKKGDKERAIKEYEAFMEAFPQSERVPEAMTRIANIESGLGNREKAIGVLKDILDKFPATPYAQDSMYLMGMVYFHSNRYPEAIKIWEKFLVDFPNAKQVSVVKDYLERAGQKEV